ncbi:MAG: hypothetical protein JNL74_21705 [Fibrobacteres bacterium]|nr:hypothetical protein [Fibrobacterota bacterium]
MQMPVVIYTGSEKCRQLNLIECPVCGCEFELFYEGTYVKSITLDADVKTCNKHAAGLTAEDEIAIQNAIERAIKNEKGRIQKDCIIVKKSKIIEHLNSNPKKWKRIW